MVLLTLFWHAHAMGLVLSKREVTLCSLFVCENSISLCYQRVVVNAYPTSELVEYFIFAAVSILIDCKDALVRPPRSMVTR